MAAVKFQKGSEEFQMMQDYWVLMQKYWKLENKGAYWDELQKAAGAFYKTYQTSFAKALVAALVEEADRKSRSGREKL